MNNLKSASEPHLQDVFIPLKDQDFNSTKYTRRLHFPSLTPSNFYYLNSAYASLFEEF